MAVSTAPSRRPHRHQAPAAPAAGLAVVPGARGPGRRHVTSGTARKRRSKFGVMFRSNPVRVPAALMLVSAVVFGLVLLNIHVAQTSFHLSDLQRQAAELETEQRRLRFEVARAESPEKIAEMGASLGLVPPGVQQYLQGPSVLASTSSTGAQAGEESSSR
jgi:hypothetical protein